MRIQYVLAVVIAAVAFAPAGDAQATTGLEGDLDKNCVVDPLDTSSIAPRWGANASQPLYLVAHDNEGSPAPDGDIDILDLQFVYGRFGSTCAGPVESAPAPVAQNISVQVSPAGPVAVSPGDVVKATVTVDQVSEIGAFEVALNYDPTLLDPVWLDVPSQMICSNQGLYDTPPWPMLGCVTLEAVAHGTSMSGTGELITQTFKATATGNVGFSLDGARFGDAWGQEVFSTGTLPKLPDPTSPPPPTPTPPPPPPEPDPVVVLVHGYNVFTAQEVSCDMETLQDWIEDSGNTSGQQFKTECLWYQESKGVPAGAIELRQRIDGISADKVDIVAHSMGGLVARYYIEELGYRNKVRSLTMLATPNWGTAVAIPPCAVFSKPIFVLLGKYDQGACDLVPLSPLIRELNFSPGSYEGVSYQVITGWVGPPGVLALPNDCTVEYLSARGLSFPTWLRAVSHISLPILGCVGTGIMDSTSVRQEIAGILLASNGLAGQSQAASDGGAGGAPPPEEPSPSTLALQTPFVSQGETVDLAVAMPSGEANATFVFRAPSSAGVTLTYALLRPGGTPVTPSDGDASIVSGAGFGLSDETQYTMTAPASGTWTMRVVGASIPESGWPYDLQALVPGGITVMASTDAGHYDTGATINVTAQVLVDDVPLLSATVDALVTKPDDTTSAVALVSDGSGQYLGSFSDTAACGLYQVTVTASGLDGTTPFTRLDRTLAVVGVPGNVILDPCNADSDTDGLTDKDELELYSTNPANPDTDSDGCTDGAEVQTAPGSEASGGLRDPTNFWDFYDTPNESNERDGAVDLFNDIFGVALRFGASGDPNGDPLAGPIPATPAYHTAFDRSGPFDANNIITGGADGGIDLFNDIFGVALQFGHSCSAPP